MICQSHRGPPRSRTNECLAAGSGVTLGAGSGGVAGGSVEWLFGHAFDPIVHGSPDAIVARIPTRTARAVVTAARKHFGPTSIVPIERGPFGFRGAHAVARIESAGQRAGPRRASAPRGPGQSPTLHAPSVPVE